MKIVFLDVDGVLNTGTGTGLHPDKIQLLNQLAEHAFFILSSNWRMGVPLPQMQMLLQQGGFRGKLVGRTAILGKESRGTEIRMFLDEHGNQIESYIVLDDLITDMDEEILSRLIRTEHKIGLTKEHANKALELLLK